MDKLTSKFILFWMLCLPLVVCGQSLTHGPIVGGVSADASGATARVFLKTDISATILMDVATQSDYSDAITFSANTALPAYNSTILELFGLESNQRYYYRVKVNGMLQPQLGSFKTAPKPGEPGSYSFASGSCLNSNTGDPIFLEMLNHAPDLFIHKGDWLYPDAINDVDANFYFGLVYDRVRDSYLDRYESNNLNQLLRTLAVDYVYDDHDFVHNNTSRTSVSSFDFNLFDGIVLEETPFPPICRTNAIRAYQEMFPGYTLIDSAEGIFHQFTYGNVDFFVLDNRSARTPVGLAFTEIGGDLVYTPPPGHTMLGAVQLNWLLQGLKNSSATFKVIVSGTTFNQSYQGALDATLGLPADIGTLTAGLFADAWAGYREEQDSILNFIAAEGIQDVFVISGDSHTSAMDDGTNAGLPEMMAANLRQTNSTLNVWISGLLGLDLWTEGGQGIGNSNFNDAFGKIETYGDDSVCLEIVDETGAVLADMCLQSCASESGLSLFVDSTFSPTCFGATDGGLLLSAAGGTPPYSFGLDNGAFSGPALSQSYTGLAGGPHLLTVRDAANCSRRINFDLPEPAPLQVEAVVASETFAGQADGSIDVTVNGGVAPYSFVWTNGDTVADISGLSPGLYGLVTFDVFGCADLSGWTVDAGPDTCLSPVNLVAFTPTPTTVQLSWDATPGAVGYLLNGRRFGTAGLAQRVVSTNSKTIGGLLPGVAYEWRVSAGCVDGSFSAPSPFAVFATTAASKNNGAVPEAFLLPNIVQLPANISIVGNREAGEGEIRFYDLSGRLRLQRNFSAAGQLQLHAGELPTGLYLYEFWPLFGQADEPLRGKFYVH